MYGKVDNANKQTDRRQSNLELYRIIFMYLIVVHHYVVNSGVIDQMMAHNDFAKNVVYAIAGGWGKLGINAFVLITGYFMCRSNITIKKFVKLLAEVLFYNIVIFFIFWVCGYETLGLKALVKIVFPFYDISTGFTSCYLLFYLLIPYLNILINQLDQKQYMRLLGIVLLIYTMIPSVPKMSITFNYVSWFCIIYLIGAFIRLYGERITFLTKHIGVKCVVSFAVAMASIIVGTFFSNAQSCRYWYFVTDSNKFLALVPAVFAFIWFKNLKIGYSRVINAVAASTFGVLMIHANSDMMRQWLWKDLLHNADMYNSNYFVLHMFGCTIGIFVVCTLIDMARIRLVERPFMKWVERMSHGNLS